MPKKYPNIITASTSVLVKEILGRLKLVVPEVVHFFRRFCYLAPYRLYLSLICGWIHGSKFRLRHLCHGLPEVCPGQIVAVIHHPPLP